MTPFPFLANAGRATTTQVALGLVAVANVAHALLFAWLLHAWGEIEDAAPFERIETVIGLGLLGAALFTGIAFLFWFRRAYGNAHAVGLHGRFGLGWAVGGWFVPFLNLVRPFQIMGEMWRHAGHARVGPYAIVGLWWTGFLVGNFADNIGTRMLNGGSNDAALLAVKVLLGSDIVSCVAALLAILIVRRLTAAHVAMSQAKQAEVFD
ncbi:MAG: DUF4328 domain-containing protein [Planctomycetes bacterium]|nr:DUF4328 domain-containing protein [Planctomycetota bacterium]